MFDDNRAHKILFAMIVAGFSFTILMTGFLRGDIIEINNDVDTILSDVGYIKGVISQWQEYPGANP